MLGLMRGLPRRTPSDRDLETARDPRGWSRDALASIGIGADLDAPTIPSRGRRRPVKPTIKAVLQDRLPLVPAAKPASRESGKDLRRGRPIPPERVPLALLALEPPDPAPSCSPRSARVAPRARERPHLDAVRARWGSRWPPGAPLPRTSRSAWSRPARRSRLNRTPASTSCNRTLTSAARRGSSRSGDPDQPAQACVHVDAICLATETNRHWCKVSHEASN